MTYLSPCGGIGRGPWPLGRSILGDRGGLPIILRSRPECEKIRMMDQVGEQVETQVHRLTDRHARRVSGEHIYPTFTPMSMQISGYQAVCLCV